MTQTPTPPLFPTQLTAPAALSDVSNAIGLTAPAALSDVFNATARSPFPDSGLVKDFRENMGDYTLTALQAAAKLSTPALQQQAPNPPKPSLPG